MLEAFFLRRIASAESGSELVTNEAAIAAASSGCSACCSFDVRFLDGDRRQMDLAQENFCLPEYALSQVLHTCSRY